MTKHQPDGLVWHDDDQPHASYPVMPDPDGKYPYRCTECNSIVHEGDCRYCATHPQYVSWRDSGVDDYGKYRSDHVGKRR